jgi:hypothetical protein
MSNPWDGFCEWVMSQSGNLGTILDGLSHQSVYSDLGSTGEDALSLHNPSGLFFSAWQVLVLVLVVVLGTLHISSRNRVSDEKPKRSADWDRGGDDGGVGGLN